jgi:hypothetical protein
MKGDIYIETSLLTQDNLWDILTLNEHSITFIRKEDMSTEQ